MDKVATAESPLVFPTHIYVMVLQFRVETGWRGSINSVLMRDTTSSILMRSFNNTSRYHYEIYSFTHGSIEKHSSSFTRCVKCSIVMILLQQICALWLSLWWMPWHLGMLIKVFTHMSWHHWYSVQDQNISLKVLFKGFTMHS